MIKSEYTANQYMQKMHSYNLVKHSKGNIKHGAIGVLILGALCFLFVLAFFSN
jgi:hypothetical protein